MTWNALRLSPRRLVLVGLVLGATGAMLAGPRLAIGNAPRFPAAEGEASAPARQGPDVELARGEYRGASWVLSSHLSSVGQCVTLSFSGTINADGESCGMNLGTQHVGFSQVAVPQLAATWLFGPTRADVDRVDIVLRHGGQTTFPTTAKTDQEGTSVRYFVGVVPGEVVARTVTALDRGGKAMSTRVIDLALG